IRQMCWRKIALTIPSIILLESFLLLVCLVLATKPTSPSAVASTNRHATTDNWRLYSPDPNHIWNRVYRSLYRRTARDGKEYGFDELDPLLWYSAKYLLTQPANGQALADLDAFLSTRAERAVTDPLQRAIMQRDLWAIFDWTTETQGDSPAKLQLQQKLVLVIKRLALSPEQISQLP